MPAQAAPKRQFTFVGGLNTESGYLTPAPNTWDDGLNVTPNIDGTVARRTRLDLETGAVSTATFTTTQKENGAFTVGEWTAVAGGNGRNFLVVQQEKTLRFYENFGTTVSSTAKAFTVDLTTFHSGTSSISAGNAPIQIASGNGKLIVVAQNIDPFVIEYDSASDTITTTELTLKIRDMWGARESDPVETRPATLTDNHNYNLLNQGWTTTHINSYKAATGLYPSNAQIWTSGKDSSDNFTPSLLDKQDFGTTQAPRGRFLLNVFSRDRNTASGIAGAITGALSGTAGVENETNRPTAVAFLAGRAWYSGIQSSSLGTWVLFSQIAEARDQLSKCYQDADPTSEVMSDLLATDGGAVSIPEAGNILRLVPLGGTMLVLAENGVWQIMGLDGAGFNATSYAVVKLSGAGCIAPRSVVQVEDTAMFWSVDGIYAVSPSSTKSIESGTYDVVPFTHTTIQTFYNAIPMVAKQYASAAYFPTDRVIYWAYSGETSPSSVTDRFKKGKLLCFDTRLKAWYPYTFSSLASNSPFIVDLFVTQGASAVDVEYNVLKSNGDQVINSGSSNVIVTVEGGTGGTRTLKFWTIKPSGGNWVGTVSDLTTSSFTTGRYRDWYSVDSTGAHYSVYLQTQYEEDGAGADKQFGNHYVTCFMKRTETGVDSGGVAINASSVRLQARWDWTNSTNTGKWSAANEAYRHLRQWVPAALPSATYDDGYPVVYTKNKVRGRGRTLQLKWTGDNDKDFQLLGWSMNIVARGV